MPCFCTWIHFLLSVVTHSLNQFWADVSYCPLLVQLEPPGNFLYLIYRTFVFTTNPTAGAGGGVGMEGTLRRDSQRDHL